MNFLPSLVRLRRGALMVAVCAPLVGLPGQAATAGFDIRDEAEFRQCVLAGAKLENIAGDLGFTEGCEWIPRDGGYLVFSDVKNSRLHR